MISGLASCEISIFKLVSVAEKIDLSLALSETPKIGVGILSAHYRIRTHGNRFELSMLSQLPHRVGGN